MAIILRITYAVLKSLEIEKQDKEKQLLEESGEPGGDKYGKTENDCADIDYITHEDKPVIRLLGKSKEIRKVNNN